MCVIRKGQLKNTAVALGSFDGVHIAHAALIKRAADFAAENALTPVALTFEPLPEEMLGKPIVRLCDFQERARRLKGAGAKIVYPLVPDGSLLSMTPEEFVKELLVKRLGAKYVAAGFNHRFGRNAAGDAELLKSLGGAHGFFVDIMPPLYLGETPVSSSAIRAAIAKGDFETASAMLGRRCEKPRGEGKTPALWIPQDQKPENV